MLPIRLFLLLLYSFSFITTGYTQQVPLVIQLHDQQGQALERAALLLQDTTGKTIKTAFSGKEGLISLEADTGRYMVQVSYAGMEMIKDTISLPGADTLSYLFLPANTQLETVEIRAQKPLIETRDDRFIYNVDNDSMARSRSLSQVLGNLPFVTTDGSGNVKVAGQSNFKVLVNGKETALFATSVAQALKGFPADVVARVELNLSPGAKYDAEGVTAIINIITRKKFEGYKGFLSVYVSDRSHYNDALTLTAKSGRWGLTLNGLVDGSFNLLDGYKTINTTPLQAGAYKNRLVTGRESVKKQMGSGTMELSYEIDSLRTLVGYATLSGQSVSNELDQQVTTLLPDNHSEQGAIRMKGSDRKPGTMAGLDFHARGRSNAAKELTLRFNWQGSANPLSNTTFQQFGSFTKQMQNTSSARNDEFTLQADAVPIALKRFTLETGVKAIIRRASTDYTSFFTYNAGEDLIRDPDNSNSFTYRQEVYAGYGSALIKARGNSIRAGLRLEQTHIKGLFGDLGAAVTDHYYSLIPNLSWSRRIGEAISLSANYNLQLLRPYITSLNPYVNNTDSLNITYGNPSLGPQQIHKVTAQVRYYNEKFFAAASLTGSWSNDKILSYQLFEPTTGIMSTTVGNVGREKILALALSSSYKFSNALRAGLWGDLRYVDIRNSMQQSQHNNGYSGIGGGYFDWDVTKRFNVSGSGGAEVSNVTLLGRQTPFYFYQVNFGYHIVKDKLFATVNWNNVHNSYFSQRTNFRDDNVASVTTTKVVYRVIFVGIQYTFGRLKQEVARKKGVVNDDILK